jgi:hypothetical protein
MNSSNPVKKTSRPKAALKVHGARGAREENVTTGTLFPTASGKYQRETVVRT